MSSEQIGFILRELDQIQKSVNGVDTKVDDVRERVTTLAATTKTIGRLMSLMIAGIPVAFVVFDRIVH